MGGADRHFLMGLSDGYLGVEKRKTRKMVEITDQNDYVSGGRGSEVFSRRWSGSSETQGSLDKIPDMEKGLMAAIKICRT